MSHFSVLVIGEDLEGQLRPYNEQPDSGDNEFMEFEEVEEEYKKQYENDGTEMIKMPDGRLLWPFDDEFRLPGTFGTGTHTHEVPEHLERVIVPFTEKYKTFEEFMKDYAGYDERDDEKGLYGHWSNPNAKWDWWVIGGRWGGAWPLKPGAKGALGEPSTFDVVMGDKRDHKRVDQARKGDIDFETMRQEARTKANDRYVEMCDALGFTILPFIQKSWKEFLADESFADMDARRDAFWKQEPLRTLREVQETRRADREKYEKGKDSIAMDFGAANLLEEMANAGSQKAYADKAAREAFSTFAVLKDGEWYERGSMGWFGMASNEKDSDQWQREFNKLIDGLPDDTLLTMVDCHI